MIPDSLICFFDELLEDLAVCRKFRANRPTAAFFYVAVDTLVLLADLNDPPNANEEAFSDWIARFLNPDSGEYIYPSHRLYLTRNALFGGFEGEQVKSVGTDETPITFSSRRHQVVGKGQRAEVKVVSVPTLLLDFEAAIKKVVEALMCDEQMLKRAKSRWSLAHELRDLFEMPK
jgi:hypothetical protein